MQRPTTGLHFILCLSLPHRLVYSLHITLYFSAREYSSSTPASVRLINRAIPLLGAYVLTRGRLTWRRMLVLTLQLNTPLCESFMT